MELAQGASGQAEGYDDSPVYLDRDTMDVLASMEGLVGPGCEDGEFDNLLAVLGTEVEREYAGSTLESVLESLPAHTRPAARERLAVQTARNAVETPRRRRRKPKTLSLEEVDSLLDGHL